MGVNVLIQGVFFTVCLHIVVGLLAFWSNGSERNGDKTERSMLSPNDENDAVQLVKS